MVNNKVSAWKWLKSELTKIQDKDLYLGMIAGFRKRAINDWGYDPETGTPMESNQIELDDWEKEFVEDIQKSQEYEIDTREEKRKQTVKEAHARMMAFIKRGGQLSDIPEDICTDTIKRLYHDCFSNMAIIYWQKQTD